MPPSLNRYIIISSISFCQSFTFYYLCYLFLSTTILKQTRPYKRIWLTRISFLQPDNDGIRLQLTTCFPCTLTFHNNSNLRMSSNMCISVIFNQSYLGIPTLPNEQPHGRYKADAWRLILSFHEINKSWPNMKTKSREMFARKWLQSSVAATTQLLDRKSVV